MFCPNCGANNNKKQNYCRFCGLNLSDTAKSLTNQLVFGEDSNFLKTLDSVKRAVDFASTLFIGAFIIGIIAYLFFEPSFGQNLIKISLVFFFLLKLNQDVIGYFQRKERSKFISDEVEQKENEKFAVKETAKILEEKPFEAAAISERDSTKLLPIENKTRKFE